MLLHYLKVAFRNHMRYKVQSLITLLGLAVSFACVSLAAYWNYYEHTYDSFLADYDRIYRIGTKHKGKNYITSQSFLGFHSYLMDNYQEVDKACGIKRVWSDESLVEINGQAIKASCEDITPEAVDVFGIEWLEGNSNVESWKENEVAISEQIARKVCGKDSPVGLELTLKDMDGVSAKNEYRIVAVFRTWPQHSNFDFHILKRISRDPSSLNPVFYNTYVRLHPNADANLFLHRLKVDTFINYAGIGTNYNTLVPMNEVRHIFPKGRRNIRLNDMKLFAGATALLSLCALVNYLTLFISRLRNRGRDMALRTICGSSAWQTGVLLMVEYLLVLFASLFVSIVFIELFFEGFTELSQLKLDRSTVYGGCAYLLLFILGLSVVLSLTPILYFKNKTLRVQIDTAPVQLGKNRFRVAGVCVQLFISLLFIFCSTMMIKQLHYLIYADINIERKNIASIYSYLKDFRADQLKDMLRQIPSITEMVSTSDPLFPSFNATVRTYKGDTDQQYVRVDAWTLSINQKNADFYGLRMKEGQGTFDLKAYEYLINETFAKQLGDVNPIGKTLSVDKQTRGIIKGIFYDYQYQPPTEPVRAVCMVGDNFKDSSKRAVAFKYTGEFSEVQAAIEKAFEHIKVDYVFKGMGKYRLEDGETVYKGFIMKELNFLKLLNILTAISILIALFGVYAQILQECERQRKNIAIRKVYGAQVKDILMMFFKEYMLQVVIAAAFAFPIGYVLMKRWLEGYSRQTSIGIEVFLGIFIGMAFLVLLCIGWHVWRAANENPATAVKKE